jgi:hypothetical protein
MEPATNPDFARPSFGATNLIENYTWEDQEISFNLCGVDDVQFLGTIRGIRRLVSPDSRDQSLFFFRETWDMTGVGYTTGLEWSLHAAIGDLDFNVRPTGERVYTVKTVWNIIGKDDAPSYRWFDRGHIVFNANGELVARDFQTDPICD